MSKIRCFVLWVFTRSAHIHRYELYGLSAGYVLEQGFKLAHGSSFNDFKGSFISPVVYDEGREASSSCFFFAPKAVFVNTASLCSQGPEEILARFALLPELKMTRLSREFPSTMVIEAEKTNPFEVCPRCAFRSWSIYDHRTVTIKDEPMRQAPVILKIRKRRFACKPCQKPFTEPVAGISKGRRFTERFKKSLLWACETFSDIKSVKKHYNCSYGFIYSSLYEQLKIQAGHNTGIRWTFVRLGVVTQSY